MLGSDAHWQCVKTQKISMASLQDGSIRPRGRRTVVVKSPPSLNENEWIHLNLLSAASSFIERIIRLAFHISCFHCNLTYWLPKNQKIKSIQLAKVVSKEQEWVMILWWCHNWWVFFYSTVELTLLGNHTTIWMSSNKKRKPCQVSPSLQGSSNVKKTIQIDHVSWTYLREQKVVKPAKPCSHDASFTSFTRYNMIASFLSSTTAASQVEYWSKQWVFQWHLTTADQNTPFMNITFQSCLKRKTVLEFSLITKTSYKLFPFYVFHYSLRFTFENRHHLFTLKLC